ncbi:MAG: hypothetical protein KBT04_05275 [Bacteroidales bacterium]|nr:hypothetical protein [Candidatus Colimorpha onthohippi]
MSLLLLIITLIVGLVLLTLEIVALPGFIAGICGIGLTIFSIIKAYSLYGSLTGNIMLIGSVIICVILLVILLKTKTWKKFTLNEEVDSKVNQLTVAVGEHGVTIARLAPTGMAEFNGERIEVHAINNFIDPDREIEIVSIDGYRIDVKEI